MKLNPRIRLTLFFSLLSAIIMILCFGILFGRVSKSLYKDFQLEMEHDGRLIAEIFKEEMKLNAFNEFREEIKEFGMELQIKDSNENIMLESDGWENVASQNKKYRLYTQKVEIDEFGVFTIDIIRSINSVQKIQKKLLHWMLAIVPMMILLTMIAGYIFSSRTLHQIESAYEKLKRFTADASHELRIPITALRGTLEVALRQKRTPEEYQAALENALEEAEHLSHLTQDLLLLARGDADQVKLDIQDVPIEKFMQDTFELSMGLNADQKVKMELKNNAHGKVNFDPEKIRQLLFNLIENAIRYNNPGGNVVIESSNNKSAVTISVQDNGVGISKEEQEKIFDRFYRVDKARSREEGGTGLGLSIVKWIVDAHKGRVSVQSELGKGTTFTITLPHLARIKI